MMSESEATSLTISDNNFMADSNKSDVNPSLTFFQVVTVKGPLSPFNMNIEKVKGASETFLTRRET